MRENVVPSTPQKPVVWVCTYMSSPYKQQPRALSVIERRVSEWNFLHRRRLGRGDRGGSWSRSSSAAIVCVPLLKQLCRCGWNLQPSEAVVQRYGIGPGRGLNVEINPGKTVSKWPRFDLLEKEIFRLSRISRRKLYLQIVLNLFGGRGGTCREKFPKAVFVWWKVLEGRTTPGMTRLLRSKFTRIDWRGRNCCRGKKSQLTATTTEHSRKPKTKKEAKVLGSLSFFFAEFSVFGFLAFSYIRFILFGLISSC